MDYIKLIIKRNIFGNPEQLLSRIKKELSEGEQEDLIQWLSENGYDDLQVELLKEENERGPSGLAPPRGASGRPSQSQEDEKDEKDEKEGGASGRAPGENEREYTTGYLTPLNKNFPKCANKTDDTKPCYLNPLNIDEKECIYQNNYWQEITHNVCFPKYSFEPILKEYVYPKKAKEEDLGTYVRNQILAQQTVHGVIPYIEQQLQTNPTEVPTLPTDEFEMKYGDRIAWEEQKKDKMTIQDFDNLNYKFGVKIEGSIPDNILKDISRLYTRLGKDRVVGNNPIPIIAARNQYAKDLKPLHTYQWIIDIATPEDMTETQKKKWKEWFLMPDASKEKKEEARDQPLSPFKTAYNRYEMPPQGDATEQKQQERWWTNSPHGGILPVNINRTDIYESADIEPIPNLPCPICREPIGRASGCNSITHDKGKTGCRGEFLYEEELIRIRQRFLKHLLEEGKLSDPLRFEWDYSMNPDDWDDMKRRHEAERAQERRLMADDQYKIYFERPEGFLPGEKKNWEDVEVLLEKEGWEDDTTKDLYRQELLSRRYGNQALIKAAELGYLNIVNRLLEVGVDVNIENKDEDTALIMAVARRHSRIVDLLLEVENIEVNHQNKWGDTALMASIYDEGDDAIVNRLLEVKEIDVNLQNKLGNSALILAAGTRNYDIVDRLLEVKNINVNLQDEGGNSALILAAFHRDIDIVDRLLEVGVDVNLQNQGGNSALILAAGTGADDIVDRLLEVKKIEVNFQNQVGGSALILAVTQGYDAIVDRLLEVKEIEVNLQDEKGDTALMLAAFQGYDDIVNRLLEVKEIDVNLQNQGGNSALMLAAGTGYDAIVDRLLEVKKIEVNFQNQVGNSALILAAGTGYDAIVDRLLEVKKIEVNFQNQVGGSALILAAFQGNDAIVNRLLEVKEIEVNLQDEKGRTALMLAAGTGNYAMVDRLLEVENINVNLQEEKGRTALLVAAMMDKNAIVNRLLEVKNIDVNLQGEGGNSALILAAFHRDIDIVDRLLEVKNINVNLQNEVGYSALIEATFQGYDDMVDRLLEVKEIEVNLQNQVGGSALILAAFQGADAIVNRLLEVKEIEVNLQNQGGGSALILAVTQGNDAIVNRLLEVKEIKVNLQDEKGRTALMLAAGTGNYAMVDRLLEVENINVNLQDEGGYTALLVAAMRGDDAIVNRLLKVENIDINGLLPFLRRFSIPS